MPKRSKTPFQCGVSGHTHKADFLNKNKFKSRPSLETQATRQSRSRGAELRTYRLAVATTGEYSEYHGDSVEDSLSSVVKVVNRVNGIFNSEVSVGFELIENNEELIFTDAETDPFEGNLDDAILIEESQAVIDDVIGTENYDIGHTFGGGGIRVWRVRAPAKRVTRRVVYQEGPKAMPLPWITLRMR